VAQARLHRRSGGAILCFVVFLIPGLPKDLACYLFGMSPMPIWVFVAVSTLGRIPDTWVLSAQGAHTAAGDYLQLELLTSIALAAALPLYYYRNRVVERLRGNGCARLTALASEVLNGDREVPD